MLVDLLHQLLQDLLVIVDIQEKKSAIVGNSLRSRNNEQLNLVHQIFI